ncbi:MAG TPA: hypothetical protein VFT92_06170 [Nitrospira sp.]|nr:hypothetical protein [Nitrospira sp.]
MRRTTDEDNFSKGKGKNQAVNETGAKKMKNVPVLLSYKKKDYRNFTALLRRTIDAEWLLDYHRRHA